MTTALLVGARTTPGVELARQLGRAGAKVIVADAYRGVAAAWSRWVARSVRLPAPRFDPRAFLDALSAIVAEERVDIVVPLGEETFWLATAPERWPVLWCGRFPALGELHDKRTFMERVAALGVPGTRAPSRGDPDHERIAKRRWSRFGRGVKVLPPGVLAPEGPEWVVQERVAGRELCALGVARDGELLGHVVYEPVVRFPLGPSVAIAPVDGPPAIRALLQALVGATRWTGPLALDVMIEADGTAVPLECNPRWTLGVHLLQGVGPALLGGHGALTVRPGMVAIRAALWVPGPAWRQARDAWWDADDLGPWLHQLDSVPALLALALRHRLSWRDAPSWLTEFPGP